MVFHAPTAPPSHPSHLKKMIARTLKMVYYDIVVHQLQDLIGSV